MLAIKTEALSKSYWINKTAGNAPRRIQKSVLKDVNIEVETGDSVAILGKNGSGKSTLLKILAGIVHPTAGCFFMNGKIAALLEVGVGFHPDLTGRENIFLKATLLGMRYQDTKKQLDAIVDFAEVGAYIDTPVKRYSSGMYLRLGFAVAAHIHSDILVIDEALSVGDVAFQQKCFKKINKLQQQEGRTVLIVSHNMDNVRALCSKAILIDDGMVTASGSALDIAAKYCEQALNTSATSLGKSRFGNGNVRMQSIVFHDKNGNLQEELYSGEPLTITFKFDKKSAINDNDIVLGCAFGVSFRQYLLIWLSSEYNVYPENGRITLHIDSLALRPGVYYFSYRIGIKNLDPENITDALEDGWTFTVRERENVRIPLPSCIGNGHFS